MKIVLLFTAFATEQLIDFSSGVFLNEKRVIDFLYN